MRHLVTAALAALVLLTSSPAQAKEGGAGKVNVRLGGFGVLHGVGGGHLAVGGALFRSRYFSLGLGGEISVLVDRVPVHNLPAFGKSLDLLGVSLAGYLQMGLHPHRVVNFYVILGGGVYIQSLEEKMKDGMFIEGGVKTPGMFMLGLGLDFQLGGGVSIGPFIRFQQQFGGLCRIGNDPKVCSRSLLWGGAQMVIRIGK